MRIVVAAGGTGGHIYPALAVLARLSTRHPDAAVRWVGGRRGLEHEVVPPVGWPLTRLWLRSLRTVDLSLGTLLDPLRLAASLPQALALLARWRPDVVYTTGGYVAIPILVAAALLRIPSLLWEGNRLAGRSVRVTGRLATVRAVSFARTADRLPAPTFVTGTPIRDLSGLGRAAARARLGLDADLPVLLVFGGSQAVRTLNTAVSEALGDLIQRCVVVHIAGPAGEAAAQADRAALPVSLRERYQPFAFLGADMGAALVAADLLVGRAGSSTLAEAAAVGLPMIVVPYPHAAAHQAANADEMVRAGAAVLVRDEDLDGRALLEATELLSDERLAPMRVAARGLGRPGAAEASLQLLEALVAGRPLPEAAGVEALTREAA
jgi:UDP-N-acetylglucosamine--N-acetylmuramyl-(pentapeptide) pyrophosphoryl-undecaprenol N-acetylglucosamine transferase